jgi:hypothetical protein
MAAAIQLNYCGQWAPSHRYRNVRYPSVSRILLPIDDMADYAMLAEVVKALIVAISSPPELTSAPSSMLV